MALGSCFGRFTKTQKFRLHITALDFLAPYAKVRPGREAVAPRQTRPAPPSPSGFLSLQGRPETRQCREQTCGINT